MSRDPVFIKSGGQPRWGQPRSPLRAPPCANAPGQTVLAECDCDRLVAADVESPVAFPDIGLRVYLPVSARARACNILLLLLRSGRGSLHE